MPRPFVPLRWEHPREYNTWRSLFDRCERPNCKAYPYYGGRGITICDRWRTFDHFLADMGPCPQGCTLDRRDNDLGYTPENCRWATGIEQANNTRKNVTIVMDGETITVAQLARRFGMPYYTVMRRVQAGDSIEEIRNREWPPKRTHCRHGHALEPGNLTPKGHCRVCRLAAQMKWNRAHPDRYHRGLAV